MAESPNSKKRPLLDKGIKFILETCRALLNFAIKRRHLSPYAENPFSVIDLDRIPIETRRPIVIFSVDDERRFFEACDDWQFPIFATLAMTGMRPGELAHRCYPITWTWNTASCWCGTNPNSVGR